MIHPQFFIGAPVNFKGICKVYPPKVNDILNDPKYGMYYKILTMSQEEIEDEYVRRGIDLENLLNPMEYLLNNCYHDKLFRSLAHAAFQFFLHEPVFFLYENKELTIGALEDLKSVKDLRYLTEQDFFDFQNLIRDCVGEAPIAPPDPDENPRIKAMKAKARYRDKVKAKQGKGLNLIASLSSLCCMNYGLNPLNIGELSYAAIPILFRVYQEKEKYELDVDSLLAGADKKKVKPKYWIRNFDD